MEGNSSSLNPRLLTKALPVSGVTAIPWRFSTTRWSAVDRESTTTVIRCLATKIHPYMGIEESSMSSTSRDNEIIIRTVTRKAIVVLYHYNFIGVLNIMIFNSYRPQEASLATFQLICQHRQSSTMSH